MRGPASHKTCSCARFVYNATLAARQAAYKAGTSLSGNDCLKMLPGLKLQYPWLGETPLPGQLYLQGQCRGKIPKVWSEVNSLKLPDGLLHTLGLPALSYRKSP